MKLSVIIPAYNEEKNLSVLHARLTGVLERSLPNGFTHELIFVNDGSRDRTLDGLRALSQQDPRVKFLSFSRNFGHEAAVAAGLDRAADDGCNAAVLIDADLQDPPELIADMIARWQQGVQVVYAQRRKRRGDPIAKKISIFIFYRLLGRISEIDIPLDTGNFRLMDRRVIDVVRTCRENPRFVRGLVPWAGFKQEPVLFDRDPRHAGETGYGFFKLARLALDGICSFSQVPLRIAIWIGAAVISLSALAAVILAVDKLFFHPQIERGLTTLACAMFFLSGVQLFMLGMLAQYVGYIFKNVQNRPMYIVAEEGGFASPMAGGTGPASDRRVPEIVVRPNTNGVPLGPRHSTLGTHHSEASRG
jgi:dolichol-phosphate mannosyltransferase